MGALFENGKHAAPLCFFEQISAIPRPSREEGAMADFLVDFAVKRGLAYTRDAAHNVLIRKSATLGREGDPVVLLQAHTDMVCEKHPHVVHDFKAEGLSLVREGNILRADGTTLGADDGYGVATMLAVLDDDNLSHPALECLFTAAEEVGLVGASRFDYSDLRAKYMLNLDAAEEEFVIVGCCGGLRAKLSLPVISMPVNGKGITLSLGGLCGGHSGEDVDRGRLNAHVLMGHLLRALRERTDFRMVSITGGEKDNAIPRECTVTLLPDDPAAAWEFAKGAQALARTHLCAKEDGGLFVTVTESEVTHAMAHADTDRILATLQLKNGVLEMRELPPVMPKSSRNIASYRTFDNRVEIRISARSLLEERIAHYGRDELRALADRIGGAVEFDSAYSGWEGDMCSPLVRRWQEAFLAVTGKECRATYIHAGLEAGLITASVKGLEAISVGPNVFDLHTPFERMELDSFERFWRVIAEFLKQI